jgi:transglutaminase-like putative cysteine protease
MARAARTPDRNVSRDGSRDGDLTTVSAAVRVRQPPKRPSLGLLTLLLLAAALLVPVASLVAANWVDNLEVLYFVTLGGILFGVAAAQVRLPELAVHPVALGLGTFGIFYVVASTLPQAPVGPARMLLLWKQLETWVYVVRRGGFGSDPALFLLLLAATAFLVGYLGAWFVYRDGTAWWPLVVAGSILVINVSYAPELLAYVLPFAAAAVLLISRVNLHHHEEAWYARGLRYTPGVWSRTLPVMIVLATGVTAFGWYMPEIPPQPKVLSAIGEVAPIQRVQDEFNRVFRGIRGRGSALPSISGFSDSLALSGNFSLANYPILRVFSSESHYWRAIVYERYTGQGWDSGRSTQTVPLPSNTILPGTAFEARTEVTQTIELIQPRGDVLVGAGQIKSVDIPTIGTLLRGTQDSRNSQYYLSDITELRSSDLAPGKRYTIVSLVSQATPDLLRNAGSLNPYPREVVSRYTALPPIPSRVQALTLDLTRNQATVYDKARAVETYLRTFRYSTQVNPPPTGRDAVDYFLFEMKQGYCDYFATAMTVMLRDIGIPSRVVSGYAAGERSSPSDPFVIRDSNAHSWVEVYFPRYGWIEFDPTPGGAAYAVGVNSGEITPAPQPEAVQPDTNSPTEPEQLPIDIGSTSGLTGGSGGGILDLAQSVGLALLAVGLVFATLAGIWFARFAGLPAPAAAYARTTQLASILGWRPRMNETPHEYASRLGQEAPSARPALRQIVDAFVALRFGGGSRQPSTTGLGEAWQKVRRGLLGEARRSVVRRLTALRTRIQGDQTDD